MARRLDSEEWQPRLWAVLVGFLLLALYVIAFVVKNDDRIKIDFVLFSASVSLIWVMVFVFALGFLGGVLLSQLYRRRRGQQSR
ncbi:MAG TPA: LapA family protein [Gaiellaceae bacterium]|nr:LapA family protein [Gaiellaceae bacterium]